MELDKENTNRAYVLGRLFAVLEKQQEAAMGKINSAITRYYSSASSTPASIFATLMKLQIHHNTKLSREHPGWEVFYKKLVGEIIDKLDGKYPVYLSTEEQGIFSIGYYQQTQNFFKKEAKNKN